MCDLPLAIGFAANALHTVTLVSNAVRIFSALCTTITIQSKEDVDLHVKVLLFEVQSCERKISDWGKSWVPEKVESDAYFMLLWGHSGQREIESSLGKINSQAVSIAGQAEVLAGLFQDEFEKSQPQAYIDWSRWRKLGFPGTNKQGLSASNELSSSVGELVRCVTELRDRTDLRYRSMHALTMREDQKFARLDDALHARAITTAAYETCRKQTDVVDLELNLLDNESDMDKVADVFDWTDLPPICRLQMLDPIDQSLIRHVTLNTTDEDESAATECPIPNDILSEFYSESVWHCEHCEARFEGKHNTIRHQSILSQRQGDAFDRLLPYLGPPQSKDTKRVNKALSQTQKKGLAFRVAECALFLLGTPWISQLSHTRLHDLGAFDTAGEFFLRINFAESPNTNDAVEAISEAFQIRRIGILLVETALETRWDSIDEDTVLLPVGMTKKLKNEMGVSYQEACTFCFSLSTNKSTEDFGNVSSKELLVAFYINVYLRLRDSYNDLNVNNASMSVKPRKGIARMIPGWT